jgi:hypothetical protein
MIKTHAWLTRIAPLLLRLALGIGFLSAVADRFGVWGPYGVGSVAWGNFSNFSMYTGKLAPWVPGVALPAFAYAVTVAEAVLGLMLCAGWWVNLAALLTSGLTLAFGVSMTIVLGIHAPLNYSVFVFSFAALLLAVLPERVRNAK